jgi:1-acyl-sn-glycerol-3-phosphate acyltransferase
VLYWLLKVILTPVLYAGYRITVVGDARIPKHGPVILAMNHRSFMDSIFVPLIVRRRVTFVAKAEYFDDPKSAWFFRASGQIPCRREGGSAGERALQTALEVLDRGGVFAIYPEGTRTRDGYLHRGHTGVARLALRSGAPIVPIGLVGTDAVQGTDQKLPRLGKRITITVGEPIDPRPVGAGATASGAHDERLVLRNITDEVMYEIQQLSGYEYRDTYATRTPEELTDDAAPVRVGAESAA